MGFCVVDGVDSSCRHHELGGDLLDNAGMSIYHGESKSTSSYFAPPALGCRCFSVGHPRSIVPEVLTGVSGWTVFCWCSRQRLCPVSSWGCVLPAAELLSRSVDHLELEGLHLDSPINLSFTIGCWTYFNNRKKRKNRKNVRTIRNKNPSPESTIPERTYFHKRTHTQRHPGTR